VALSQISADQDKMKLEQHKATVRGYLNEAVNNCNLATFSNYFSDDVLFNGATGFRQQLAAGTHAMRVAFPDYHLTILDQIAEGDKVVTRVSFQGTHQGDFNGVAPTGRPVEWSGIAIDRIANGKVVEMWHLQNISGLLQQIGASPSRKHE
jgi:predicted ester cyclase